MKITRKIKLMTIPLVLLPVTLLIIAIWVTGYNYLISTYGETISLYHLETLGNPVEVIASLINEKVDTLWELAESKPDLFLDYEFLETENKELENNHSFLIVRKDETFIYQGKEDAGEELLSQLPEFSGEAGETDGGLVISNPDSYYIKQRDFVFGDGSQGSVFILSYLGDTVPQFKKIIIKMSIIFLMILMLTSSLISWYAYWGFARPIKLLKDGTNKIKEGNLDFQVQFDNNDELGELCHSFNEMRGKLKESIDVRLQYEEKNRELISNISHDLKTPITAIKGYVEGIMDGVADTPEKMDRYIKTIYNKANELDALINELSLYTKIDNNAIPYNFQKINADVYFKDCIEDIGIELEEKNIELAYFNYCREDVYVAADPEQMKRVINNIVTNAVKYNNNQKGHINLRLRQTEDMVQVEIEDNGKGIDEADLPLIFNRTFRADSARKSQGGSGLGLAIAKRIVEEHGGEIWATSKVNVGTTIYFTMNIYKEDF